MRHTELHDADAVRMAAVVVRGVLVMRMCVASCVFGVVCMLPFGMVCMLLFQKVGVSSGGKVGLLLGELLSLLMGVLLCGRFLFVSMLPFSAFCCVVRISSLVCCRTLHCTAGCSYLCSMIMFVVVFLGRCRSGRGRFLRRGGDEGMRAQEQPRQQQDTPGVPGSHIAVNFKTIWRADSSERFLGIRRGPGSAVPMGDWCACFVVVGWVLRAAGWGLGVGVGAAGCGELRPGGCSQACASAADWLRAPAVRSTPAAIRHPPPAARRCRQGRFPHRAPPPGTRPPPRSHPPGTPPHPEPHHFLS